MKTKYLGFKRKSAPAGPIESRTEGITGYFDGFHSGCVVGWVARQANPGERLEVEVLVDGKPVGRAIADNFRADLLDAGIGDGKHAFNVMLPYEVSDGVEHQVEVRERVTGSALPGSPRSFRATTSSASEIRLEGGALVGYAPLPEGVNAPLVLEILEAGTAIAVGHGLPDTASRTIRFNIGLPTSVLDGRPHVFSVRSNEGSLWFGDYVGITPHMLTPEDALRQYVMGGLKPSLAIAAGHRYEALVASIRQLADREPVDATLAQLVQVHDQLVRGPNERDAVFPPLEFPAVDSPVVSVVIPVHNKFHITYHCLASLLLASNRATFEVIVVDDGSSDTSTRIPELVKGIQYVRNEEAQGFVRACNRGAILARGDYIVMLNNDTEVTHGWLDELLWPFEQFDRVGMTGAKLIYPDGRLQEAGGIVWSNGQPWNYGRGGNAKDPRYNYTRQVDYISGACIMLPRSLWEELNGFDEAFAPAYYEDTDLAFRVREKGYKTVYTPFSEVIHFEGVSSGTSTASGMKRYQDINAPKFKKRWIGACRHNGKEGVDVELNKDRNVEFRALVLDAETPMPDQNAGSYAAIQEMRMLQALGFKCTFVPQNMAWMGRYTEDLQRMGVECIYAPFALSVHEVIEKWGQEFDLVYITRYYVAQEYVDKIRKFAPQAKIVMNNADLHFLRELRVALESKSKELVEKAVQTREIELATMRKVDLVLTYTDVEKAVILSHNLDSTRVSKCPWVTEVVEAVPDYTARKDIAFMGGYKHYPNVDAVEWFIRDVMPLIRETLPGVNFRVYGSNVPDVLRRLADAVDDVIIEGWVADVRAVFDTCRVFVAPLRTGAGIKGKVLSALAHGVPCVLSPIAAEGIPLSPGVHAAVATKPSEWARALTTLYSDRAAWDAMSAEALRLVKNHYGFSKAVAEMREILQEVGLYAPMTNRALAMID